MSVNDKSSIADVGIIESLCVVIITSRLLLLLHIGINCNTGEQEPFSCTNKTDIGIMFVEAEKLL